jgi:predicted ATPase/DNA-binding CsgD family transcriptional regulator
MAGLPVQLDSFVGRNAELQAVLALTRRARLTTLVGTGGIGKTRLAIEVARRLQDEEFDAAYFVDLARTDEASAVEQIVLTAVGGYQEPGRAAIDSIIGILSAQPSLLVIDNCEHLVDAVSRLVDLLMKEVTRLGILATSREPLNISGEAIWTMPPLNPADSVRLFRDRAGELAAGVPDTYGSDSQLAELCSHLDYLPLAIELAAAWARHMPVEEIQRRLERRFALLTRGDRLAVPRHRTLLAAIDWSYKLLQPEERTAFPALAAFVGGFSIEAAEAVADCSLDVLAALVDKSMVVAAKSVGDRARYRLLETVHEFAYQRLKDAGAENDARRRHFEHFAAFAHQVTPELRGPQQPAWKERLDEELSNIRAALDWGAANDPAAALVMAVNLIWFWKTRGHIREGREWFKRLVDAAPDSPPAVVAAAITEAGDFASLLGEVATGEKEVDVALELYETLDDHRGRARALLSKAWIASRRRGGIAEITEAAAAALGEAELSGDELLIAECLLYNGRVVVESGRPEEGKPMLERAVEICRRLNDLWTLGFALTFLSVFYRRQGNLDVVRRLLAEDLEVCMRVGDKMRIGLVLTSLGMEKLKLRDDGGARGHFEAALTMEGASAPPAVALNGLAQIAGRADLYERALKLNGAAHAIPAWYGPTPHDIRLDSQPWIQDARRSLGEAKVNALWQAGFAMAPNEAVSYALSDADLAAAHDGPLTAREQEIARLVAKGLRNRDIAAALFISPRTVDAHVEHIRDKLGFQSRAQIAAWVIEQDATKA